jgi:hypothetical protein
VGHAALIRNGVLSSRSDFASHAGRARLAQVTGLYPATARKLLPVIFTPLTKDLDYWFLEERLYQGKLRALEADTYNDRFPATA